MKDKKPSPVTMEGPDHQDGHWPEIRERTPLEERRLYPGEGMILADGKE
jgi:hypothetical protein